MDQIKLMNDPDGVLYTFTGETLGQSSSWSDRDKPLRWTEITIYKTDTGKYVVHNLGCSDVYHRMTSKCASGDAVLVGQLDETSRPCPVCEPTAIDPTAYVRREVDRSNVFVSTTPAGVIEGLVARDDDGVLYLTKTTRRALDEAAKKDPALKQREVAL